MNKLVDMKQSKSEKRKDMGISPATKPGYPYGLELRLGHEELKKLGLDISKFKAGEPVAIAAQGSITNIRSSDSERDGKNNSIEIQLKKVSLSKGKAEKKASKIDAILYGGKKGFAKS